MTLPFDVLSARPASLSSPQLVTLQRLWRIGGLTPISGYGIAVVAMAAASDRTLADTLSSVDFNEAGSVTNAIDALLQWRERAIK
jgi:hypothetical protein